MSAPDLSRVDWIELRRQSIGASEAAAACGEDPVISPAELVLRKRGEMPDVDLSDVEAVRWGSLLEPAIVEETARRAELHLLPRDGIEHLFAGSQSTDLVGFVEGRQPFLRSRARPWQTATPDGIGYSTKLGEAVAIEAKNVGQYLSGAWDTEDERAPDKFRVQVAHQLAVAPRLSSAILSGLIGGNSLRSVRFERVRIVQVIDAVVAIEERIWRCVTEGGLPELSGPSESVARALDELHPDDNGEAVVLGEAVVEWARELALAKAQYERAEAAIKDLSNRIRAAIGDATFGFMPDGSGFFSLKTQERAEHVVRASKSRRLLFAKHKAPKRAATSRS